MSRNYSSTAVDTTLTSGVSAANTTLAVASTTGFPAAPFVLAVDAGAAAQELVLVTAVGGLSLTVTRGYDSTVAATHESGAKVSHSHAAIDFREAGATKDAYDTHAAATAAHGATGAVVGTTNTQTLTNKTLSNPSFTGLPAGAAVTNGTNVNAAATLSFLRGPVAMVIVSVTASAALSTGATLFTLPAGHRPPAGVFVYGTIVDTTGDIAMRVHVDSGGVVTIQNAVTSGRILRGSFVVPL